MTEFKDVIVKVRMTKAEKEALEIKADGKPLSTYLRDSALSTDASETKGDYFVFDRFFQIAGSPEAFWDKLVERFGTQKPSEIYAKLFPDVVHPFSGYTVDSIHDEDPFYIAYLVPPGSTKPVPINPNHPHFNYLRMPDGTWLVKEGMVIGEENKA